MDATRWRERGRESGLSRMATLGWRHRILREVREWFHQQGFMEVETPTLVKAPSPEAVFSPITTLAAGTTDGGYLITSPEFQLKRMLVGGFEKIYRLGPVFRGGELGAHHNPEFTMLEWYRIHQGAEALGTEAPGAEVLTEDLAGLFNRLAPLVEELAEVLEEDPQPGGAEAPKARTLSKRAADLSRASIPQATVAALFKAHLGMDIRGVAQVEALIKAVQAADDGQEILRGVLPGNQDGEGAGTEAANVGFTEVFTRLWLEVEQRLPPEPLLVVDWPAPLASLARLKPDDPTLAERVELYAGGLELANGFAELTDPVEQRRRFEKDLADRKAQGLPQVPLDEAFLGALAEGMPPAAGMALGVDRLVMYLTAAPDITHVLPFAWDER